MISYETPIGTVTLSNEYLIKLIGHAVVSCYGVVKMVPQGTQKFVDALSKKERLNTGIIISNSGNAVSAEIHIAVSYGMNINAIAESIVHKVEYTLSEVANITIGKIMIKVDGIVE